MVSTVVLVLAWLWFRLCHRMTEMHKLHSHKQKYTQLVMSDGCLMGQREVEAAFEGWVVVQGFHISHE